MTTTVIKCLWCGSKRLEHFADRKDGVGVLKCKKCSLYMASAIPEDLKREYYNETYYNAGSENVDTGYAETYDLMAPSFLLWQNSLIEETNEAHDKESFLEIGSATGNLLEIISDNQKNLDVEGIDISEYAVEASKAKGLVAQVANIENYHAKSKKDIIFSSETMEHLDDLGSFLKGVSANLQKDGVFLFYVPSISVEAAKKDKVHYIRFNTNLEHLLYFTPGFFEIEFKDFFDAEVVVKEVTTGFGPCIVGAVSKNQHKLADLKSIFNILTNNVPPSRSSDTFLKNLVIISLKFAQFELAEKTLELLRSSSSFDKRELMLLDGIKGYHNGNLILSNESFEAYLREHPGNRFVTHSLLANEREINKLLTNDNGNLQRELNELRQRTFTTEAELRSLQQSKVIGPLIVVRQGLAITRTSIKKIANDMASKSFSIVKRIIPSRVKRAIKYLINRQWLVKRRLVENERYLRSRPLVSVIIPFYNHGMTIEDTIDSLRKQTFQNFEVVIVNDGSTERDSEVILGFRHEPKFNIITHKTNLGNGSPAAARNSGLKVAKGKYIVCLDADDILDPTYLEKCLTLLETTPSVGIATTDMRLFGVQNLIYKQSDYNASELINNNMVITAAMYDKEGWEKVGGYKLGLGYEDWDFWICMAEAGYWGRRIPEPLFNYRTAVSSRYVDDQSKHKSNMRSIKMLHSQYQRKVKKVSRRKHFDQVKISPKSAFNNLDDEVLYKVNSNNNPNVLITIPWMTFGGAETLIYNYCREVKDSYNITFVTGLKSENEWEYKFKEITPRIYHLANLFEDEDLYVEFISNYISTRRVDVLHIIHNGFTFKMLSELRHRHPSLKVVVTMFNDRVSYFQESINYKEFIDTYVSDNHKVARNYQKHLRDATRIAVIPNGINCYDEFNPVLFDRYKERDNLGIGEEGIAVFFVGRLSEEKNPDIFLRVAERLLATDKKSRLSFFIIGDGPMRQTIEKKISSIRTDRIKYLGYQTDIARYLSAADVFVLPSSIEGFPLSILEAMAMRVAIIASRIGAVPEIVADGVDGFVVKPGSVDEIAEAITKLANDHELLERIKIAARLKLESNFSNAILKANYLKLYKEVTK